MYLSKVSYENRLQVKDAIIETESDIKDYKSQLLMWASSTPKDVIIQDDETALIFYVQVEINRILEGLHECTIKLYNLQMYLEYLEENNIEKVTDND